ncbi:murein biosynthesis integral membrane protein MurJ [Criibacterium bergeronii]|uniref:Probable lipid II flippase MurJ n=1 Tax=Criibacterium bergeronii TaxID=1871336 RepID=A0A552V714_9FIRM|nr:murein biosynthesis integral membrane protein MurJ [Criibacterium bergeronii]TRW26266.1 murein biosynthesis integral membrane protein MurJ [Criibacterium bergeronii]
MSESNNKAVKTVSCIFIITFLGKILALVRDIFLANQYGTSMYSNAFLTASRIPRVLFDAIFASAITSSFIPIFNKSMNKEGEQKAFEFSDVFISCISIFMTAIMILCFIFARQITSFFADGFDEQTLNLSIKLLYILLPTMICTGLAFSFTGILQSMDEFLIPASISVVFNLVIISYYFTLNRFFGIFGLAVFYLIGWIMQVLIQVPSLKRIGYKYNFKPQFDHPYFRETLFLMIPVMVSTWVQPFNIMINAKYASRLYFGAGVSAIEFANNLYTMLVGVIAISVMNFMFPKISMMVQKNEEQKFKDAVSDTSLSTLFLVIPLMFGVMSLSASLISLIYGGNKFDSNSVNITSTALYYFSLGMPGYCLQAIFSKVYFAKENGKVPMIAAIVAIAVNYVLCIILVEPFAIGGVALASSISVTVNALILLMFMQRDSVKLLDKDFLSEIIKMVLASAVMYIMIKLVGLIFGISSSSRLIMLVKIGIQFVVGVITYFIIVFILKTKQTKFIKDLLNSKLNKNRGSK